MVLGIVLFTMEAVDPNVLVVFVTAANAEEAARISEAAVKSRQAACATTVPGVQSLYWWEGKLVNSQESMVMLKTTVERYHALQATICSVHSYEVPEILAIQVAGGHHQYLEWVTKETTRHSGGNDSDSLRHKG